MKLCILFCWYNNNIINIVLLVACDWCLCFAYILEEIDVFIRLIISLAFVVEVIIFYFFPDEAKLSGPAFLLEDTK